MTEFVRFVRPEAVYGEKNILHSELGLLSVVKKIRAYKKLRAEELILRIALKKKFDESLECLQILDKLLPHDKLAGLERRREKAKEEKGLEKENLSLEQELESIRRKIEGLQRE